MALNRQQLLVLFLVALLSSTALVSSFSISKHRSSRSTDLSDALAILQRQRRRVGVEEFLNSQRLLAENRPLTLEDLSDWLSRSNENDDVMPNGGGGGGGGGGSWIPETGRFNDFRPSGSDIPPYMSPVETLSPMRIKASENEVNDIFDSDEDSQQIGGDLEKKEKEEMVNPKGDDPSIRLPSSSSRTDDVNGAQDLTNNREMLNSLTDEEIRVLMKAVGKLQHRANTMAAVKKSPEMSESSVESDGIVEMPNNEDVIISEPVTQEELKSVFKETNGPISKETIIVGNKDSGEEIPEVIEQEIVAEKMPDDSTIVRERELTNLLPQAIENEIEAEQENENAEEEEEEEEEAEAEAEVEAEEEAAAAAEVVEAEKLQHAAEAAAEQEAAEDEVAEEIANISKDRISPELVSKYLLLKQNKLYNIPPNGKGVTKRTSKRASGIYSTKKIMSGDDIRSLMGDIDLSNLDTSSLIQAFVVKIVSLQNEIDGLRFKNRLEDLENDELTDALNEATMGQKEGSVSSDEWNSLQHAIEIEQALQDLKKKQTGSSSLAESIRGISRDNEDETDDEEEDDDDDYKRKRGEPWKRSRDNSRDVDVYSGAIASRSLSLPQDVDEERNADIERLLKSSYLMNMGDDDDNDGDGGLNGGNEDEPFASLFLSHADRCPAIQLYSNNCELADLYNLPVDFEARALCNLHEMCYACGHSLSVSQSQCDLVYRAAVSSLCHQKEVCVAESEIFLRTMKLKTRYIPHVQPSCRSRCTAQFMGMF